MTNLFLRSAFYHTNLDAVKLRLHFVLILFAFFLTYYSYSLIPL